MVSSLARSLLPPSLPLPLSLSLISSLPSPPHAKVPRLWTFLSLAFFTPAASVPCLSKFSLAKAESQQHFGAQDKCKTCPQLRAHTP